MNSVKSFVKRHPWLSRWIVPILARLQSTHFEGSTQYWESRYRAGETSGVGSIGRLAQFKAGILNEFVERNAIETVIELGCGDGSQLGLMRYPNYVGVDVSDTAIALCRARFRETPTVHFYAARESRSYEGKYDLTLSLDVLYHLVEDEIFEEYLNRLFSLSRRFVIVYSTNFNQNTPFAHVRHREFTSYLADAYPSWSLTNIVPARYPYSEFDPDQTSDANFYIFERGPRNGNRSLEA